MKTLITAALFACTVALAQEPAVGSFEFIQNISGNRLTRIHSVAAGSDGSIFVAGLTNSSDFAITPDAARRTMSIRLDYQAEVFVRKLSPDGTKVLYSTLVGPTDADGPVSMGVDAAGDAYVAYRPGRDDSQPVTSLEPSGALVIVKLSPDGTRFLYRVSLLPEGFYDSPIGFAVDTDGSAFIASGTYSLGIRKVDPRGTRIEAQTKVACSGNGALHVNALALGADKSVYLAGRSACTTFPATANAYRSFTSRPFDGDAFVMRFAPNLAGTIYATLLGGEATDEAFALSIGDDGSATVAGQTTLSPGLDPMPATPLGIAELKPNSFYSLLPSALTVCRARVLRYFRQSPPPPFLGTRKAISTSLEHQGTPPASQRFRLTCRCSGTS